MESKVVLKIENEPTNNPFFCKTKKVVCITDIFEWEKYDCNKPNFAHVKLTFSLKKQKFTVDADAECFDEQAEPNTFSLFFSDNDERVFEFTVMNDETYLHVFANHSDFEDDSVEYVILDDLTIVYS